jgi:hypothetical protein
MQHSLLFRRGQLAGYLFYHNFYAILRRRSRRGRPTVHDDAQTL